MSHLSAVSNNMYELVAVLSYRENYGAHAWDGKGECPQRWKFKGGIVEVVKSDISYADAMDMFEDMEGTEALVAELVQANSLEESNNHCIASWEGSWNLRFAGHTACETASTSMSELNVLWDLNAEKHLASALHMQQANDEHWLKVEGF